MLTFAKQVIISSNRQAYEKEDILRTYQSYSLAKISALSKQQLIAQYAQCEKLEQLNQQLESSNETNRKLLDNQIRELKRQEKLRYYKTLAFNLNHSLKTIESQGNKNFKIFLGANFLKAIGMLADDATSNLEEIADKEYASGIASRASALLADNNSDSPQYTKSCWYSYTHTGPFAEKKELDRLKGTLSELQKKSEKGNDKPSFGQALLKIFFVCSLVPIVIIALAVIIDIFDGNGFDTAVIGGLIFSAIPFAIAYLVLRKGKKKSLLSKQSYEAQIEEVNAKIIAIEAREKRQLQDIDSLKSSMSDEVPDWEQTINEIAKSLPTDDGKEASGVISNSLGAGSNLDDKFKEAAALVVTSQKVSSSFLQMKLGIGYAKAARILDQLEAYGVISPMESSCVRKVLCSDLNELKRILGE